MPGDVAHEYLVASAEAWPFSSVDAFRYRPLYLGLTARGLLDEPTQKLAGSLEVWLRTRAGGLSIEALRRVCEHTWFGRSSSRRSLAELLVDLAGRNLQLDGPRVVLLRDSELPARLAHIRWLSLQLPPDLLVAARCAGEGVEPPGDHICLLTPQLAQLLCEQPVAETHLHLGAAMSFGLLWSALLPALGRDPPAAKKLRDVPFGDPERFLYVLTSAAIARVLLAFFLCRHERNQTHRTFGFDAEDCLPRIAPRLAWPWGIANATSAIRRALRAVVNGEIQEALPYARLCALHRLFHPLRTPSPSVLADVLLEDPLSAWISPGRGRALPETRFSARALEYLLGPGRDDHHFAMLFWQYQRVRGLTYRYLVQEPGTAGLDWFFRHYSRISPLRRPLSKVSFNAALELQSRDVRLGAIEARIGPETSWVTVRDEIRSSAAQAARFDPPRNHDRPEVALLVHFIKERETGSGDARRLHASPASVVHGVRFGQWGYKCLRGAMAIETALDRHPELLLLLRGIDIASAELAVPTWPVVPLFDRLRQSSRRAAAILHRRRLDWHVEPLRVTCHAGEDYGRLVEGLRRVHELIESCVLGPGDRIGHGVCLGDDVSRWARKTAVQPAEERLDDLLWELDRYGRGDFGVDHGRYARVRAEAWSIGHAIYEDAIELDCLGVARRMRHSPRWLGRFGYPFRRSIEPSNRPEELLARYLRDPSVFVRGQKLVEVPMSDGELVMLRTAQAWVRSEICRLEITVESNPSSNMLIGDLAAVEEHSSFRMAPLPGSALSSSSLLLSINTDDPITFASSLADEYAHLYGALCRSSVPASDALAWLAERRRHGYRSRFSLSASANEENLWAIAPRRAARTW